MFCSTEKKSPTSADKKETCGLMHKTQNLMSIYGFSYNGALNNNEHGKKARSFAKKSKWSFDHLMI